MTNENVYEDITEMEIDEEKVYRLTKYKGKEIKETDHNTIFIKIKDDIAKQRKEKQHIWKTNNKESWDNYKSITEDNEELDQTWINEKDVNRNWREWKDTVHNILNTTLGKIRITNNNKQGIEKEVKEMMNEKREIRKKTKEAKESEEKNRLVERRKELEKEITKKLEERDEEKLNEMTKRLNDKRNNYDVLWKIKKNVQKKKETAHMIKDKEGNDLTTPEEIKDRTSEYCKELYKPNEVVEGYESYVETLENFIEQCWKMTDDQKTER